MTVTIKSNAVAANILAMSSGFNGKKDFNLYADFNNQYYLKDGARTTLSNVLLSDRATTSVSVNSDNLYDFSDIPANTPIRSYIYDHKTFAIYPDYIDRFNRLIDTRAEVVWLRESYADNATFSIYSLDVGNAFVDSSYFDILSGDGSASRPMIFKHKVGGQQGNYPIKRANGCVECVVQSCYNNEVLLVPAKNQKTLATDKLRITLKDSSSGTIFLKVAGSKRKLNSGAATKPLVKMQVDNQKYIGIAITPNGNMVIRYFFENLEQAIYTTSKAVLNPDSVNKIAISWSNGVISVACNGNSEFIFSLSMGADFKPISAHILSEIQGWSDVSSNMCLLEMAYYDYRLVSTEIENISNY